MKNRKHKLITYIALGMAMIGCIITMSGTGKVYCDTITPEQEAALIQQYHGVLHDDGTIFFADSDDSMAFNDARTHLEDPDCILEEDHAPEYAKKSSTQTASQPVSADTSKQTTSTQATSKEEKKTEFAKKADAKQIEETTTVDNTPVKNEVTKKPTCTEDGERTYYNKNGDVVKTEKIVAIGHDYKKTVTKEPTCTEDGEATYTCKNCGDTYTEKIPKTGHKYEKKETLAPTCTETGVMTYVCQNCGDTYTEDIPALGHKEDKGTITKKAGLFTNGEKTYKCTVCGKVTRTEVIQSRYPITYLYIIIGVCAVIAAVVAAMIVIIRKKKHYVSDTES